jgi:hypothetical protein
VKFIDWSLTILVTWTLYYIKNGKKKIKKIPRALTKSIQSPILKLSSYLSHSRNLPLRAGEPTVAVEHVPNKTYLNSEKLASISDW